MAIMDRIRSLGARIFNSGLSAPAQWLIDWVRQGEPAASGESVNEVNALGLAVYIACIRNISEDIAKLPFGVFENVLPRGKKELYDHPVSILLRDEANPEMSAMSFRETLTSHALGWHGGFAEIVRTRGGTPVALWPLDPTCVERRRDNYADKQLYYLVHGVRFAKEDIFDLHGLGYDGISGYVMARLAKDPIGNALAAQKFAGAYFANGTVSSGVINVPDAMSETAFKHLRESFAERHGGSKNQHRPIILEQGATWTPTSVAAKDSQMIEVLWNGVEEICRLFRMPPHKVQHLLRATFSNIASQATEYVQDALLGWGKRWESETKRKLLLPGERNRRFTHLNFNMLMRGDPQTRAAFYRELNVIGALSINDIRELEDMNPVEGGDTYFVNAALVPLKMAVEGEHIAQNQSASPESSPQEPASPGSEGSTEDHRRELIARVAAAHSKSLEDTIGSLLRVEHDKVVRAAKRPGFKDWCDDFYGKNHRKTVSERLSSPILALSASINALLDGNHASH